MKRILFWLNHRKHALRSESKYYYIPWADFAEAAWLGIGSVSGKRIALKDSVVGNFIVVLE